MQQSDYEIVGKFGFESRTHRLDIENQCFENKTPDFTPKNVKSGVFLFPKKKERWTSLMNQPETGSKTRTSSAKLAYR